MKLFKMFEQYIEYCFKLYSDKKWSKLALNIMLFSAGAICASVLIANILLFGYWNFDKIVKVVGRMFLIIIMVLYMLPKKKPEPVALPETTRSYDPLIANSTYSLLRTNMVSILAETADELHLRIPTNPSQIDAPIHFDIVNEAMIFHFLCGKQDATVSLDLLDTMGVLQNTLERRLNNHELMGISQSTTLYKGMAYPAIMIDNVVDSGRYIQIDVAIVNEKYLHYRINRLYNSMDAENYTTPHDRNF